MLFLHVFLFTFFPVQISICGNYGSDHHVYCVHVCWHDGLTCSSEYNVVWMQWPSFIHVTIWRSYLFYPPPSLSLTHVRTNIRFLCSFSRPLLLLFSLIFYLFLSHIFLYVHTELLDAWIEMLVKFIFENDFFFLNLVENFLGV